MSWAPVHGAQVPKVWALQNEGESCILWHSSRKTDSRLRSGCTKQGYITAMIKFITKYSIRICLTQSFWLWNIQCLIWSFRLLNIQFQSTQSDPSNYWIFNSDPPNPTIWAIKYSIPTIEYSDPCIPIIPTRLIQSFRLLNIQFRLFNIPIHIFQSFRPT